METLPFIDDHVRSFEASADAVWTALIKTLRKSLRATLPRPVAQVWGLQQTSRVGAWKDSVSVGDSILGFTVAQCEPSRLLTLRGAHRFSRYELRFELQTSASGSVEVHAKTYAVFPGFLGMLYRALVIGSGGHRIVVRWILRRIARQAAPLYKGANIGKP
jgi:hypothetical protein